MKRSFVIACLPLCFLFLSSSRAQTVSNVLPFQGILTTTGGITVPDGMYQLTFRLYEVPTGGSALWEETQTVTVTNGIFSVLLGSVSSLTLSFDQQYYLGISIGGGAELQPRLPLGAAPYSFYAQRAGSVTSGSVMSVMQAGEGIQLSESGGKVTVTALTSQSLWDARSLLGYQLGITSPSVGDILQWDGSRWVVSQIPGNYWGLSGNTLSGSEFLGSMNNQPVVVKVNGQEVLRLETTGTAGAAWSIHRGGGNTRGLYAVDLQGERNASTQVASGDYSVISGGRRNTASGSASTIGGGELNTVSGDYNTVGGGYWNTASGIFSTVGGGYQNTASGAGSFVGGGGYDGSNFSGNDARASASTIAGGYGNVITSTASYATISGGSGNTASDLFSTVGGGSGNNASKYYSTVVGGAGNTASGIASTVSGGLQNAAGGDYSWAGGRQMYLSSSADRSFVWGYATSTTAITAADAFLIGPYGNSYKVGINVLNPTAALHVSKGSYSNPLRLEGLQSTSSSTRVLVADADGVVYTTATNSFAWLPTGNSGTDPAVNFLGTTDNQPIVVKVNGQEVLRLETTGTAGAAWSIHRGGGNTRGLYSVDLQGDRSVDTEVASGDYSVISGGQWNTASGSLSAVGGGYQNTASGSRSAVGGGYQNTASGFYSTVGGGYRDTASGSNSTVGGGYQNTASGAVSAVCGGYQNTASGNYSTIGGGYQNTANDYYSTVCGGFQNTASGSGSAVCGGYLNTANGYSSAVCGGFQNTASGSYSAVGGGVENTASGDYSWAGGRRMYLSASGDRTFVWGYATSTSAVTASDAFLIGPYGNTYKVGINLSAPSYALELPNNSSQSVGKARANAWDTYSDARIKSRVHPIGNAVQILQQLRPVYYFQHNSTTDQWGRLAKIDSSGSWNYGFIAQELVKVLPEAVTVPADSLQLWGVNYDILTPVLTAAMQQLFEVNVQYAAKLQKLEQENAELKQRMAKMAKIEQQMEQMQQQVNYLLQQLQSQRTTTVSTSKEAGSSKENR